MYSNRQNLRMRYVENLREFYVSCPVVVDWKPVRITKRECHFEKEQHQRSREWRAVSLWGELSCRQICGRPAAIAVHRANLYTHIKYIHLMITISRYNLFRTKHNKFSN